eukprot:EG_transcript_29178
MVGHGHFTADPKAEGAFSSKAKSSTAAVVGGLISGPIDAYLLQPTDAVKTKQQMCTASRGMLRTGREIVREEGLTALWKGATPFATNLALKYCLRWGSATHFINLMRDEQGRLTAPRIFAAGAMAGALEAVAIVTPFEVVKTRLQVQKAHALYRGPGDVVRHILAHEGPRGFWRGLAPTFTRNTMNQAANQLSKPLLDRHVWGLRAGDAPLAAWQSA